jgi:hypothetical protein
LLAAGILYRPREVHARQRHAALDSPGAGWGDGVGPVPGQPGAVIPYSQLPQTMTRRYTGYSREFIADVAAADTELLAARGYRKASFDFVIGSWRGSDWLGALFLFVFFFVIGVVALLYLASSKPTGMLLVTYERVGSANASLPPSAPRFGVQPA